MTAMKFHEEHSSAVAEDLKLPVDLGARTGEKDQSLPGELRCHNPKAIVVHAGRRDSYQLALGLQEAGLLRALVTDLFWSGQSRLARRLDALLPDAVREKMLLRSEPRLDGLRVHTLAVAALGGLLLDKGGLLPFRFRRWLTRLADAQLGRAAGRMARENNGFLVSYSYYAYDAFRALGRGDVLFQMHPHPATMRRLLQDEMVRHPESTASLRLEWELALPEQDFDHLVAETKLARAFLVASSFTRDSLIEHGADPVTICVVPYGVDLELFRPAVKDGVVPEGPLKVLFVGRMNERKGLRYLLEAINQLPPESVDLTICGRLLGGMDELKTAGFVCNIRPDVSTHELIEAYQSADIFVLPSIAEGFGQVLLEALACGLPILATSHTAAPDLIEDGVQGFIVEPQRADQLAGRLLWGVQHREDLISMRVLARARAEHFSWNRFRAGVAEAVAGFMASHTESGGEK